MTELDSDSFDVFEEGEMIGGDSLSLSCDIDKDKEFNVVILDSFKISAPSLETQFQLENILLT